MNKIVINNEVNIVQDPVNENIYTMNFASYSEALIKSFVKPRIILGATASLNYKMLKFKASSVQTLSTLLKKSYNKKLSVPLAAQMLQSLTSQLNYLIVYESKTIIGYSPENIIVIDGTKFLYICADHLLDIIPNSDTIMVTFPYTTSEFITSPELYKIKEIPTTVHYKSSYYSLGCLLIYVLTGDDDLFLKGVLYSGDNNISESELSREKLINNYIDSMPIKGTKLYWLLKRTLVEDAKNRSILLI
uniref:Protein kinase domain-containing protein n=1 Tax=viral metagenome TaxID=1070528 RepID=A0A6C0IEB5_9ZZZZ